MHKKDTHRERDFSTILYFCRVCKSSNKRLPRAEEHAERHRGSNIFQGVNVKDILKKNRSEKKTLKQQIETKCSDQAMTGENKEFEKRKSKGKFAHLKFRKLFVNSSHYKSLLKLEEEFRDIAGFESVRSDIDLKYNKVAGIVVTFKTPKIARFALKCVYKLQHKDSSLLYQWRL